MRKDVIGLRLNRPGWLKLALICAVIFVSSVVFQGCSRTDKPDKDLSWVDFETTAGDYMGEMEEINARAAQTFGSFLQEMLSSGRKPSKKAIQKMVDRLEEATDILMKGIKAIKPPAEFKKYHRKLIESIKYAQKQQEALLNEDKKAVEKYTRKGRKMALEAQKELYRLFQKYNAPEEEKQSLKDAIALMEKQLK